MATMKETFSTVRDAGTFYTGMGTAYSYFITSSAAANASAGNIFYTGSKWTLFRITGIATSAPLFHVSLYEAQGASATTPSGASPSGASGGWGIYAASGAVTASAGWIARNRVTGGSGSNCRWLTASGDVLTTSATQLSNWFVGGGTGVGGTKSGGDSAQSNEWLLKPNTVYDLHWITHTADTDFNIRLWCADLPSS